LLLHGCLIDSFVKVWVGGWWYYCGSTTADCFHCKWWWPPNFWPAQRYLINASITWFFVTIIFVYELLIMDDWMCRHEWPVHLSKKKCQFFRDAFCNARSKLYITRVVTWNTLWLQYIHSYTSFLLWKCYNYVPFKYDQFWSLSLILNIANKCCEKYWLLVLLSCDSCCMLHEFFPNVVNSLSW